MRKYYESFKDFNKKRIKLEIPNIFNQINKYDIKISYEEELKELSIIIESNIFKFEILLEYNQTFQKLDYYL
jgi:hypothetical protein